jgi:hypothetical protein
MIHFAKNKNISPVDFQDLDKIRAWARELPGLLNV